MCSNLQVEKVYLHQHEFTQVNILGGQGVLISKELYNVTGGIDYDTFPQYGADTDFYLRASNDGFNIKILSDCTVYDRRLNTGHRGEQLSRIQRLIFILFSRRSHEAFRVKVPLFLRHVNSPIRSILRYSVRLIIRTILQALGLRS